jgi:hypothetical protein
MGVRTKSLRRLGLRYKQGGARRCRRHHGPPDEQGNKNQEDQVNYHCIKHDTCRRDYCSGGPPASSTSSALTRGKRLAPGAIPGNPHTQTLAETVASVYTRFGSNRATASATGPSVP